MFRSVAELVERAEKEQIPISAVMILQGMDIQGKIREAIYSKNGDNGTSN